MLRIRRADAVEDHLYPGAEVTVAEGAFLGFAGIVVRLLPARQRVQILFWNFSDEQRSQKSIASR